MPEKTKARIVVTSRQGQEETVQEWMGEVFAKEDATYIRYEEPEEIPGSGATRTLVKVTGGALKIMRHGGVEAEQTFEVGRRLPGFYRSPLTSFNLSTRTRSLETKLTGTTGHVVCEYDLYVFENLSGHFAISLHIQEEQE